jgi:hypothetical protein
VTLRIRNARFSTISESLRISQSSDGTIVIEINPFGHGPWITVDYAKVSGFQHVVDTYRSATNKKFFLTLSADDIMITSGALSTEMEGSITPNHWFVTATEARLTALR